MVGGVGEALLQRQGWSKGEGLGREKQGIKTHLRTSRKQDQKGIGVTNKEFSFQWWDHMYNKSTANVQIVVAGKAGNGDASSPAQTTGSSQDDTSSAEAAALAGPLGGDPLASMFVKAVTAPSGSDARKAEGAPSKPGAGTSTAPDRDYSSNLTDAELFVLCEGRTAHKGARANVMAKVLRSDKELGKKLAQMRGETGSNSSGEDSARQADPALTNVSSVNVTPCASEPTEIAEPKSSKKRRRKDDDEKQDKKQRKEEKRAKKDKDSVKDKSEKKAKKANKDKRNKREKGDKEKGEKREKGEKKAKSSK